MIERLAALFSSPRRPADETETKRALAALLIEAARTDGAVTPEERASVAGALARWFGLAPAEAAALTAHGEAAADGATQLFGFTRVLARRLSAERRVELMEVLYEVAYADGRMDDHQAALLRRVGQLVYVPDRERMLARRRVLRRLGRRA